MGFTHLAPEGLKTGSRHVAAHVVSSGGATFVLESPIRRLAGHADIAVEEDRQPVEEMHTHLEKLGDAVKHVAFAVDDVKAVHDIAVAHDAISIQAPTVVQHEVDGEFVSAGLTILGILRTPPSSDRAIVGCSCRDTRSWNFPIL